MAALTVEEIRKAATQAYETADAEMALLLCETLATEGVSTPAGGTERVVYRTVRSDKPRRPVLMRAKYAGTCASCRGHFTEGAEIYYAGRKQCYHVQCFTGAQ